MVFGWAPQSPCVILGGKDEPAALTGVARSWEGEAPAEPAR